jgi:CSLREA domain-containing protein
VQKQRSHHGFLPEGRDTQLPRTRRLLRSNPRKRAVGFRHRNIAGVFLTVSAQGATFTVNSQADIVGAAPLTDGICATAYNNGVPNCTLRAAIMEANHAPGGRTISVPPGPIPPYYSISGYRQRDRRRAEDHRRHGCHYLGASNTIIDANGAITSDRLQGNRQYPSPSTSWE